MDQRPWKAELKKQFLDSLKDSVMSSNLPDMLINRDILEQQILDCPSALNFCSSSRDINNEVCKNSDYIRHCRLKSFMMRKNAQFEICLDTETPVSVVSTETKITTVNMRIQMQWKNDKEMEWFKNEMMHIEQKLGISGGTYNKIENVWFYTPPSSSSDDPVVIPAEVKDSMIAMLNPPKEGYQLPSKWLLDARRAELEKILKLLDFDAVQMENLYTTPLSLIRIGNETDIPDRAWLKYKYIFHFGNDAKKVNTKKRVCLQRGECERVSKP